MYSVLATVAISTQRRQNTSLKPRALNVSRRPFNVRITRAHASWYIESRVDVELAGDGMDGRDSRRIKKPTNIWNANSCIAESDRPSLAHYMTTLQRNCSRTSEDIAVVSLDLANG